MIDFRWMSTGGILLDGNGDIAVTSPDSLESVQDIVRTRLKAAFDGWKMYKIGADLQAFMGNTVNDELEVTLRRQVTQVLSKQFLPRGSFQVESLAEGSSVRIFVYLDESLITTATVQRDQPANVQIR